MRINANLLIANKGVLKPQGKPWKLRAHEASLEILNFLISSFTSLENKICDSQISVY